MRRCAISSRAGPGESWALHRCYLWAITEDELHHL